MFQEILDDFEGVLIISMNVLQTNYQRSYDRLGIEGLI